MALPISNNVKVDRVDVVPDASELVVNVQIADGETTTGIKADGLELVHHC
jgi:hypothetical protein